MKCEECQNRATDFCLECQEPFCSHCISKLHSGGKRRSHTHLKICLSCESISSKSCTTCSTPICIKCELNHLTHEILFNPVPIIYIDLQYLPDLPKLQNFLLNQNFSHATVKIYSKTPAKIILGNNFSVISRPLLFNSYFLMDLKNDLELGYNECFIIGKLDEIKEKILKLQNLTQFYLFDLENFKFFNFGPGFVIRYFQRLFIEGRVLVEFSKAVYDLGCLDFYRGYIEKTIEMLEKSGLLLVIHKEFNHNHKDSKLNSLNQPPRFKLHQVGLKVKEVDMQVCLSILRSLKLDEIFPTEKAIQSRIRELFSIKLTPSSWQVLIQKMQNSKVASKFSLFSQDSESLFDFQQISYEEEKLFAIYPKGEKWVSSDQFGDIKIIKSSQEWTIMLEFLSNFFNIPNENIQLTGGKYGCALLLKHFSALNSLSIGKLTYMIQLAINEDIIRYQKTLLVWTQNYQIKLPSKLIQERLENIRNQINKILKAKPAGVPLAQIPILLKRRLKFNLKIPELGYKKLKDLLKVFPEVYLYPENSKNPSAYLNYARVKVGTIESFVNSVIENNAFSVTESFLIKELRNEFGEIDWKSYGCEGLLEFLKVYVRGVSALKAGCQVMFIGREGEKDELSISTHNSEYFCLTNCEGSDNDALYDDMVEFLSN